MPRSRGENTKLVIRYNAENTNSNVATSKSSVHSCSMKSGRADKVDTAQIINTIALNADHLRFLPILDQAVQVDPATTKRSTDVGTCKKHARCPHTQEISWHGGTCEHTWQTCMCDVITTCQEKQRCIKSLPGNLIILVKSTLLAALEAPTHG